MVGNSPSVTAEPARTPAPSVPKNAAAAAGAATSGKNASAGGEELPVPELDAVDVAKVVERLNELSSNGRRNLLFRVDEHSGRTVITVVNAKTAEVIRQIPSEEVLAVARAFAEIGALIDTRA